MEIAGPQPGLDVNKRHMAIKGGQRRRHHRRGVALGRHAIGPVVGQGGVQPGEAAGGHVGQRLVWRHQAQVAIDFDAEVLGHLVEHLAVLAGGADDRLDPLALSVALVDQRGHLHGLGPGAEDQQHAQFAHRLPHVLLTLRVRKVRHAERDEYKSTWPRTAVGSR